MIFRVLDYETTGFAEDEKAEVIEIGTTDLVADDENESDDLGRSWQTFVKPTWQSRARSPNAPTVYFVMSQPGHSTTVRASKCLRFWSG